MKLLMAAVDEENRELYLERGGRIYVYDIAMFAAALENPKYWESAERCTIDETHLSELLSKHGVIE